MSYELLIQHGSNIMYPPTVEGVTIEWERKGQPGKLTFEVVKTPGLSFQEGDPCRFSVDGTPVFYGFVFEKSRKGNNPNVIKCVVYDQLYYLKNKDTYAVNFETTPRVIAVKLSTGGMMHASFGSVQYVNTGKQGIDGTTFYPSVEGDECTLSWTNDGNKENPKPVNLRGRQGPQGAPGSDADILPITNLELEKLLI